MTQQAVLPVREVITRNHNGYVDGVVHYKDFWAYVERKKLTRQDIQKMKADKREDFFLKWKHGMSDPNTNWEFEYSLRSFLKNFKDTSLDQIDPTFRTAVKLRREFEDYCDKTKMEIGLRVGHAITTVPKEVQDVLDEVGGTLVGDVVKNMGYNP